MTKAHNEEKKDDFDVVIGNKDEALWALNKAKADGLIGPDDTSILFHSLDTHHKYLTHLSNAFDKYGSAVTKSTKTTTHAIAVKTNPHPGILRQVVQWGFGLECASMEEVYLAVHAGCPSEKIVFDSPVKTKREIQICHESESLTGLLLNVNSLEELNRIPDDPNFVLGLRINPLVDTGAPSMFHVSSNESKFGVPLTQRRQILEAICNYPVTQLHVHSGTAMANLDSAVGAIASVVNVAIEANAMLDQKLGAGVGRRIVNIDIGGGLRPEILEKSSNNTSRMESYVQALQQSCPGLWDFNIITEFGQWSYFYSGYAYSKIEYALQRERCRVVYVHLGADFLLRDVYNKSPRGINFVPVGEAANRERTVTDIAGPLCFAGDYLMKSYLMPKLEEGDEILLLNTGSNAFGLWSRHCSRSVPMVVGVSQSKDELTILSQRFNPFVEKCHV